MSFVLALDQGTTSSRAMIFGREGRAVAQAQEEFPQLYPQPGHVEHDPEAIWRTQLSTAQRVLNSGHVDASQISAIGVTNQRETTILWEKSSGSPIANAIVWQSRITAPICEKLKQEGLEPLFREKTGLILDAYFSGTKIAFLLDAHAGLRARAERGEILFGTVDSFLIWRLTGGKVHVTDVSNASRTLLLNLHTLDWDEELLKVLNVPRAMLPEVRSSSEVYGETDPSLLGRSIPVAGCAGDQQAATFGQCCFSTGDAKNTYGTGCFLLMNTGNTPVASSKGLLATVGWRIRDDVTYCLEGSVFIAGAVVQWLRDGLGLIQASADVEPLADAAGDNGGVYFVPAFVGLGTPYWNSEARGLIIGLTRGSTASHIARAAVESMAFQTADVLSAMQEDSGRQLQSLRVDGGASGNNSLMQFQADMLGVSVVRPTVRETTALGAAYLAGLATGVWEGLDDVKRNWEVDRQFEPSMAADERERLLHHWHRAVDRSKDWARD